MTSKVIDIKYPGWRALFDAQNSPTYEIAVGVLEGAGHNREGIPIATYAHSNEFGTEKIPPRSFLRSTLDEKQERYTLDFARVLRRIVEGKISKAALAEIGVRVQNDIKEMITNINSPPNAPMTIALKGFDNPLIETGLMRNKIDHDVRPRGSSRSKG